MDNKQRKKVCKLYIVFSTAEMSMQLRVTSHDSHNYVDTDEYLKTMRYDDQSILSQILDLPEQQPLVDNGIQSQELVTGMFSA